MVWVVWNLGAGGGKDFTTKHTKGTKFRIQRQGAKDAKAGAARFNTVENRAVCQRFAPPLRLRDLASNLSKHRPLHALRVLRGEILTASQTPDAA
jgi:hypothetical protein